MQGKSFRLFHSARGTHHPRHHFGSAPAVDSTLTCLPEARPRLSFTRLLPSQLFNAIWRTAGIFLLCAPGGIRTRTARAGHLILNQT